MTIKYKRLGGPEDKPYCIEIQGYWPDATALLIHLERLEGITVFSKASSAMTDEVQIEFSYKGYPFIIESPFAYLWISADSPDVPESIFEEIVEHIKNYKTVWPHQMVVGMLRHLKYPRWRR
ncbi:MAG: hypothetical protein GY705_26805 [Bacteroidetes bacterium]|nr:hypothetical protein [Bacteroidota bacterium]